MTTAAARTPIRIARIITRLNVGGPAIQAIEMSARLESIGYHTLLVHGRVGADEGDMQYLAPPDPRFEMMMLGSLRREVAPTADGAAVARVLRLLTTFRPAIVHTHMAKAGAVGRVAALAYNATVGRRERARLVHTYHGHVLDGYFGSATARTFAAIERTLARRTDALVAVSGTVRDDLRRDHGIDARRFPVIPLGFDLSGVAAIDRFTRASARREFGLDHDTPVVAFVGRLTAVKQPLRFVDAAAHVARADARARFLVAGGGELEAPMRAAVDAAGLGGRVQFLGWRRDLIPIYAAADVLAITSVNEGTPVALIESMAAGISAVSFAVGGVPDVLHEPGLGVMTPRDDVAALADAIVRLLADADRRAAIGIRARQSALARFGVDRLVRDLDALYRDLVG